VTFGYQLIIIVTSCMLLSVGVILFDELTIDIWYG